MIRVLSGVWSARGSRRSYSGGATADTPDPKKLYTDLYLSIGFCGYAEISGDICLKSWRFANSLSPAISPRQVKSSPRCLEQISPPGLIDKSEYFHQAPLFHLSIEIAMMT